MPNLHLIPITISDENVAQQIPSGVIEVMFNTKHIIAENAKTARRYIKKSGYTGPMQDFDVFELNKHEPTEGVYEYLKSCLAKKVDVAVMSEAGCPGIADPGSFAVEKAHQLGYFVQPYVGPNSIILTLMASGFNGQSFTFHGYLPKDKGELKRKLIQMETESSKQRNAHLFIETPYRNAAMIDQLTGCLKNSTKVCIGINLQSNQQKVITKTIGDLKKSQINIDKIPAVFAIQS